jgi:hypothetical protein
MLSRGKTKIDHQKIQWLQRFTLFIFLTNVNLGSEGLPICNDEAVRAMERALGRDRQ